MEVEEVESRIESVVHRYGRNVSAGHTSCVHHALRHGSVLRVRSGYGCHLPLERHLTAINNLQVASCAGEPQ